jgi:hypothetical protein
LVKGVVSQVDGLEMDQGEGLGFLVEVGCELLESEEER